MSESTRKKVIFGILLIAIIWGYNNLKSTPKNNVPDKRSNVTATTAPAVGQAAKPTPAVPKLVNIEKKALEPWGEDPFRVEKNTRRVSTKSPQTQKWQLSGILYNSQTPVAIINNQQVKTGDTVDNARVLKIDRKAVMLEHNGTKMTITVTKG